ncbi:cellulase family glycosylhydrolase [Nocardioides sp. CN2-186]|uniref:glycoside hydrolase family 5 protein n=1 Tax=Nocardioides tweenelious TaxID=3156607 RepID=UPI0032B44137
MRVVATLVLLVAGLLVAPVPAEAGPTDGPTSPTPPALSRLHVTTGKAAAIRNADGARVLLNGVNVMGLGEYYQPNPDFESNVPIGSDDFEQIAALGFNSVRLVVSWSRLEPTRGAYDTAYVDEIRAAVAGAAAQGLYTVIDMHQDAWGIAVNTPDGVDCPEGSSPANGWDGAPAWATITDGATTCRRPGMERELAPAVQQAWKNFYANTQGIQTELVKVWGRLAGDFADETAVAGYDLLNEPGFGPADSLGKFYDRTITAIRKAETRAGGFHHIAFYEPSVTWSAFGSGGTPPPDFTADKQVAFAPHVYAETFGSISIADGFAAAAKAAKAQGVPLWIGEWGYFSADPADDADRMDRFGAAEDDHGYGGAWWSWKQACGNPHVIGAPGGQPGPISQSLVRYLCPDETAVAPDPAYTGVLSRPLPRAVPGTTTRLDSDGRTGTLVLVGQREKLAKRCSLRVFVPGVWAEQTVRSTGIHRIHTRVDHGNVVLRGCVERKFSLRIG